MGRGKDLKIRKRKELKKAELCPIHGTMQIRRKRTPSAPRGDLKCILCHKDKAKKYRADNPEKLSTDQRRWYSGSPSRYMLYRAKGRAKKCGVAFDLKPEDVEVPKYCPVLGIIELVIAKGKTADDSASLDRIKPEKGYVRGNVQVISYKANRIKTNATLYEIRKVLEYFEKESR